MAGPSSNKCLSQLVTLRAITLEDLPAVRHLHALAYKVATAARLSEAEIEAFARHVRSVSYCDDLLREHVVCAFIHDELVGTAGWCPADDRGVAARIRSVFVRPLFAREGLGQTLVRDAEARARKAGFREFTVQAGPHAQPFFAALGYEVSSYGTQTLSDGAALPVVFMRRTDEAGGTGEETAGDSGSQ